MEKGCSTFSFGINHRANGFQILNSETLKHVRKEKRMALRLANILRIKNSFIFILLYKNIICYISKDFLAQYNVKQLIIDKFIMFY